MSPQPHASASSASSSGSSANVAATHAAAVHASTNGTGDSNVSQSRARDNSEVASTSAAKTEEGRGSHSPQSPMTGRGAAPLLPGQSGAAPAQGQTATSQPNRNSPPHTTTRAASASPSKDDPLSAAQQQQPSLQQQFQQQQQHRGQNEVTREAGQLWGDVQQKGPAAAWRGRGQGPAGGSGGSWAQVDDNMEAARQLLSPWRWVAAFQPPLHLCPYSPISIQAHLGTCCTSQTTRTTVS